MEKRYRALRTIGTIYKVLAAIVAGITLLSILGLCQTNLPAPDSPPQTWRGMEVGGRRQFLRPLPPNV